jgi:hypothetical protein
MTTGTKDRAIEVGPEAPADGPRGTTRRLVFVDGDLAGAIVTTGRCPFTAEDAAGNVIVSHYSCNPADAFGLAVKAIVGLVR